VKPATVRCFLGIELPPFVRERLAALSACWQDVGLRGSWVRRENLHITVRFLGSHSKESLEEADTAFQKAFRACAPLRLRIAGSGAFPDRCRPRVLWAGIATDRDKWDATYQAGAWCASLLALTPETKLSLPHVTLVRMRRPPDRGLLNGFLEETRSLRTDAFTISSVALWQSTLRPGGACYQQLREYPLA